MQPDLRNFMRQYLGAVGAALVPVLLTTFVSIPLNLGVHPGEPRVMVAAVERHLT